MGFLLRSTICHYCDTSRERMTDDHIVPRCDLWKPQSLLPYWFRELNSVPACKNCNNEKGAKRSNCDCEQCTAAWAVALKYYLPQGYTPRGYYTMRNQERRVG